MLRQSISADRASFKISIPTLCIRMNGKLALCCRNVYSILGDKGGNLSEHRNIYVHRSKSCAQKEHFELEERDSQSEFA